MANRRNKQPPKLGARERQILDVVYAIGRASVSDVRSRLADPPSYSSVRTMLGLLESKGFLKRDRDGVRHLYTPTRSRARRPFRPDSPHDDLFRRLREQDLRGALR